MASRICDNDEYFPLEFGYRGTRACDHEAGLGFLTLVLLNLDLSEQKAQGELL